MPIIRFDQLQQFAAVNILSDPGAVGGPVVIPFGVQINIAWTLADGKTGHNITYGRTAGVPAPTVAQAQAIFSALTSGAQWTALAASLSNSTALASVSLTSVHTAGLPTVSSTGTAVSGSNAALALPNEVALVVTLRTSFRGASNRGRVYIPGYAVDQVIAGNVASATAVSNTGAWVNNWKSVFSSQGLTWAIGQRERSAYIGSTGTSHPARAANVNVDVQFAQVRDNHWDSQRRRGLR